MKVELLVNLKLGDGRMISAGSVYSDKNTPIPDFIMRRLSRGMAKIVEYDPSPPPPFSYTKKKPEVEKDTVLIVTTPKTVKKVLKKTSKKEK